MSEALISEARKTFHRNMLETNTLTITKEGIVSNADSSSASSKAVALRTAEIISGRCGQSDTFLNLKDIRAGAGIKTSDFAQYEHLELLSRLINDNPGLAASIGSEYIVIPDIIIYRDLYDDDEINSRLEIVNQDIDCVYHFALYELAEAVKEYGSDDSSEMLETLINGKRLKDISDLPLDLAV